MKIVDELTTKYQQTKARWPKFEKKKTLRKDSGKKPIVNTSNGMDFFERCPWVYFNDNEWIDEMACLIKPQRDSLKFFEKRCDNAKDEIDNE